MSYLTVIAHIATWMGNIVSKIEPPLDWYFPNFLLRDLTVEVVTPDHHIDEDALISVVRKSATGDAVADGIKLVAESFTRAKAHAVMTPDQSIDQDAGNFGHEISISVDGFVEEPNGGAQTDKTSQARSDTANDLNLCPMSDSVGDKVYVGCSMKFLGIWWAISTAGVGSWAVNAYYWNGSTWSAVVNPSDGTSGFTNSGSTLRWTHTPQGDWATTTIQSMTLYWIKFEVTAFTSRTTKPLGDYMYPALDL